MIYNNYRYSFFNEDDDMSTDDETVEVDVDELEGKDYSDTATVAESVYLAMYEDAHNWNKVSDILTEENIFDKIKRVFDTIIETIKKWIQTVIGMITGFIDKLRKKFFAMGLKNWLKDNKQKLLKSTVTIESYTGYAFMVDGNNNGLVTGIISAKEYTSTLGNLDDLEKAKKEIEKIGSEKAKAFAGSNATFEDVTAEDIIEHMYGDGETVIKKDIPTPQELANSADGFKAIFALLIKIQNECKKSGKSAIDQVNKAKKTLGENASEEARECTKMVRLANRWNNILISVSFKMINYVVKLTLDMCKVYVSGKSTNTISVASKSSESSDDNKVNKESFSFV